MVGVDLKVQDGWTSQGHAELITYPSHLSMYTTLITMRSLLLEGAFSVS